jgi:hypothetical protein
MQTAVEVRRRFIHTSIERPDQPLSEKYNTARSLRLTVAVEVDTENRLVEQSEETPSHFCDLPLIGSERHVMPIIINSPDFEPDSERVSLILDGPDRDLEKQQITEAGINRLILLETIPLFHGIVSFLVVRHHNLHLLLRGMKSIPVLPKFDRKWFEAKIIIRYRRILTKYPMVETEAGMQRITNGKLSTEEMLAVKQKARVLFVRDHDDEGPLYDLYRHYFGPACFPVKALNATWVAYAWDGCGVCGLRELCEMIQALKSSA